MEGFFQKTQDDNKNFLQKIDPVIYKKIKVGKNIFFRSDRKFRKENDHLLILNEKPLFDSNTRQQNRQ